MLYIGLAVLAVTCVYLLYKNYQTKKMYESEILKIKNEMKKTLENNLKKPEIEPFNNPPEIKENVNFVEKEENKFNEEQIKESSTYDILKTQYDNYTNSDQYDSNSEERFNSEIDSDLKSKIDSLEDNIPESDEHNNLEKNEENKLRENVVEDLNIETQMEYDNLETQDITQATGNIEEITLNNQTNFSEEFQKQFSNELPEDLKEEFQKQFVENLDNDIPKVLNEEVRQELHEYFKGGEKEDLTDNFLNIEKLDNTGVDLVSETLKDSDKSNLETNNLEITDIKSLETNTEDKQENYKNYTKKELENMTLKQLQKLAKENKIKVKGKKTELIERFIEKKTLN